MSDLSDFGAGAPTYDAPDIERKRVRWTPDHSNVDGKIAGFVGVVYNRGDGPIKCYTSRRFGQHLYQKENAWPISQSILDVLERLGVSFIYVWDGNTGKVYEYRAQTFYSAPQVPAEDLETTADPQRYLTLDDALRTFDEVGEEMFRRDFDRAMDYCLK